MELSNITESTMGLQFGGSRCNLTDDVTSSDNKNATLGNCSCFARMDCAFPQQIMAPFFCILVAIGAKTKAVKG